MINEVILEKYSSHHVSKANKIDKTTLERWIHLFTTEGVEGLRTAKSQRHYSKETKLSAVKDYLNNEDSLIGISRKYGIRAKSLLSQWVSQYTRGKELKATRKGLPKIPKSRKTTHKERMEIVLYALARGKDYRSASEKYGISYDVVLNWVKKYESGGPDALIDHRGKGLESKETLTELERTKHELKAEKQRNEYLEAEVGLLKKLKEIERRDQSK